MQPKRAQVLGVDVAVPARKRFYRLHPEHLLAVIRVLSQIALSGVRGRLGQSMVLQRRREILHTTLVLHLVNSDRLWTVDVDQDLLIELVIFSRLVPERVDHHNILAGLQHDFFRK